jgi:hypothetical protein
MRSLFRSLLAAVIAISVVAAAAPAGAKAPKSGRVISPKEAVLERPSIIETKTLMPDQGCQVLLDTGDGDCAVVKAKGRTLVFTIEPLTPQDPALIERPWAVRVYAQSTDVGNGVDLVLENPEQQQRTLANVEAKVEDVTGDGKDEIVFGYRSAGTGGFLEFDVVLPDDELGAVVAAHERLAKGTVVVKPGKIVTYDAIYDANDATCCPTFIERSVIKYKKGKFRVAAVRDIPSKKANVPPGDLG